MPQVVTREGRTIARFESRWFSREAQLVESEPLSALEAAFLALLFQRMRESERSG